MIQIRTAEGILTLSNATDVRTTGILCVRGHKGVTLGYVAPTPVGWLNSLDVEALEQYVAAYPDGRGITALTLEQAAADLIRQHD